MRVQARSGDGAQAVSNYPSAPATPSPLVPEQATARREVAGPNGAANGQSLIIAIQNATKRFGDVLAVDDVSLTVPHRSIVSIIGPSGAGKTTTIRLITGSLAPDTGRVEVLGEDPRRYRRRTREQIGYMPQGFVLYPDLTSAENVSFMAALFGIPPWRRGKRVAEVLELVDLTDAANRRASALSGGMQRRLELACALVHRPKLLILDEPTSGIDPLLRTRIWQELERLRQNGVTVLVTTQYVSEAEYCDAVALISEGQLIAFAPPLEMRKQALGGEVIEVATSQPIDAASVRPTEGVVSVRQQGPRQLLFVVADAGTATPRINDAIESAGGTVEYSREYRPTFDEVFSALVTAHADRLGTTPTGDTA